MAEPIAAASVTLLDIYTRQVEISSQLAVIHEQLKAIPDHENRLRILETARARIYGAAAALGALAGSGAAWIALALAHVHH